MNGDVNSNFNCIFEVIEFYVTMQTNKQLSLRNKFCKHDNIFPEK
jgi:hypothetical protein